MRKTRQAAPAGLPMPFVGRRGGARFSRAEWDEYRVRRAAHLDRFPDYDARWHRPDSITVNAVWSSLGTQLPPVETMLPAIRLSPIERQAIAATIRQAIVVALTSAVLAGERGQMLTTNRILDALAAAWSDHDRAAVERGRATCSYEMRTETVRASWRDLLRNGIDLKAIWETIRSGCQNLYTTERIPERGYTVTLNVGAAALAEFRAATAGYRGAVVPSRLLLADEPVPRRPIVQDTAAEWHYNVVAVGERSIRVMDQMEQARVLLDVPEFLKTTDQLEQEARDLQARLLSQYRVDVTRSAHPPRGAGRRSALQWSMKHLSHQDVPAVKALVEQYRRVTGHLAQIASVYDQVYAHSGEDYLEIRTGISKGVNRRYIPRHFWPLEVTGKDLTSSSEFSGGFVEGHGWVDVEIVEQTSRRGRWFRAAATTSLRERERVEEDYVSGPTTWDEQPLVGFDVSASQVQILSVFLGLDDLEAMVTRRPHKELLAEVLWTRAKDPLDPFILPTEPVPFGGSDDPKLRNAGKTAVMTRLYGSEAREIAHKLRAAPTDFGPGLGDAQNVERLFERAGMDEVLHHFLPACRAMAERLCKQDPYGGFVFRDPFDGTVVRWNPVRLAPRAVTTSSTKGYVNLPVGTSNAAGDYPVDAAKLGRTILPCLVHTLDAAFAGFVVEALRARGVRDVVSVHDCWMVAADAEAELLEAIREAGEPWLRSLGPVYNALRRAIGNDPAFGPRVRSWEAQWRRRVAAKRWPTFLVSKAKLWDRS
jgi:hypothetical protein